MIAPFLITSLRTTPCLSFQSKSSTFPLTCSYI